MWAIFLLLLLLLPLFLSVHAEDLGELSANPFNSASTSNPFGAGSPFKPDGLNNPSAPTAVPSAINRYNPVFRADRPKQTAESRVMD